MTLSFSAKNERNLYIKLEYIGDDPEFRKHGFKDKIAEYILTKYTQAITVHVEDDTALKGVPMTSNVVLCKKKEKNEGNN